MIKIDNIGFLNPDTCRRLARCCYKKDANVWQQNLEFKKSKGKCVSKQMSSPFGPENFHKFQCQDPQTHICHRSPIIEHYFLVQGLDSEIWSYPVFVYCIGHHPDSTKQIKLIEQLMIHKNRSSYVQA